MTLGFFQPRFEGERFKEHTLPLDIARDLAAYEKLVVELSKHLYLKDHPNRKRVPRGFGADFHLHIEKIEEGSSRPVLSLIAAGAMAFGVSTNVYFEKAKELIPEIIAAPEGEYPEDFPKSLLVYFNVLGRSLQDDEFMELPRSTGDSATLTPQRRKELVLAASQVYEREVTLTGTIEEIDFQKKTFRLCPTKGQKVEVPIDENFDAELRKFGGRERHQVTITGVGAYDYWDKLTRLLEVEPVIDVQENYQIASQLDKIRVLEDGWYEDGGQALSAEKLDEIADNLIAQYPETLPIPAIVPTPEGDLLLEWRTVGEPSLDINLQDMSGYYHGFGDDGQDVEEEFELSNIEGWGNLFEYLVKSIHQENV